MEYVGDLYFDFNKIKPQDAALVEAFLVMDRMEHDFFHYNCFRIAIEICDQLDEDCDELYFKAFVENNIVAYITMTTTISFFLTAFKWLLVIFIFSVVLSKS